MKIKPKQEQRVDLIPLMKGQLASYFSEIRKHALDQSRKIAWCTTAAPVELLRAMDFEVYFPEKHWELLGSFDAASDFEPLVTTSSMPSPFHSFLLSEETARNIAGSENHIFNNLPKIDIPEPDLLVFNTIQGNGVKEWSDRYSGILGKPVVGLSIPQGLGEINKATVKSVVMQLRNIVLTLEAVSGRKFDIDRFRETVALGRECAELWQSCLKTSAYLPAPWSFFEHLIYMIPAVILRGTPAARDFYQLLFTELVKRVRNGSSAIHREQVRLLWDGMPLWNQHLELNAGLGSMNSCIVASTCCNFWDLSELEGEQPFNSMAAVYSGLFINRSAGYQTGQIQRLKREYRIDGILFNNLESEPYRTDIRNNLNQTVPVFRLNQPDKDRHKSYQLPEIRHFIEELADCKP